MALIIKEVWVPVDKDGETEWKECVVISLFKASMSRHIGEETMSTEQMFIIAYYPETGELIETPLNESIIKKLYDGETGQFETFSAPEEGAGGREEDR